MKIIVVGFVALLPLSAFSLPTVTQEQYSQIIEFTNNVRNIYGKTPLDEHKLLDQSALQKSKDMGELQFFAHVGPGDKDLRSYLKEVDYKFRVAGENLSMGFATPEDVVVAWINSPTHFANLIDPEYKDIGVGVASGMFNNIPTSYVTQHFGQPKVTSILVSAIEPQEDSIEKNREIVPLSVKGYREKTGEAIEYLKNESKIYWTESNGSTEITVQAHIHGDIKVVQVFIDEQVIPLFQANGTDIYTGFLTLNTSADELFKVIMEPSIIIKDTQGNEIMDTIPWNTVKLVQPNVLQKYDVAQATMGGLTKIFEAQKAIYIGFLIFFSLALIVSIVIEIRKQHHHVIMQTFLLLSLLVWMITI